VDINPTIEKFRQKLEELFCSEGISFDFEKYMPKTTIEYIFGEKDINKEAICANSKTI
jgi:hypothetical protein